RHLRQGIDIGLFEETLSDHRGLDRHRVTLVTEQDAGLAEELRSILGRHDPDLRQRLAIDRERAIGRHRDRLGLEGDVDRAAALVEEEVAVGRHDVTLAVAAEGAGTGQPLAGRRQHPEETFALDREIEHAVRPDENSLYPVRPPPAGLGHRDRTAFDREGPDDFGKQNALAPEAGRRDVGDVVCHRLHLLQEPRLAGQRDIACQIHSNLSPGRIICVRSQGCGTGVKIRSSGPDRIASQLPITMGMIASCQNRTSVWPEKLIDAQNTTRIAASFGTKVSVISWIEVSAWTRPMARPAISATESTGSEITSATQSACRRISRRIASVILRPQTGMRRISLYASTTLSRTATAVCTASS